MIEVRRQTAVNQAEGHEKMVALCWAFRAQLEDMQSRLSPADYIYAEALKTFLLRARGVQVRPQMP
ncbi:hypothetical protein MNR01_12555 [Lysobacter sp. S4-A87]|uniref:hypothetical protein n=1 Tax=Lysobacter sp. S4-A87 TaxID=2925843 RepID=UPI001F539399|nr:hypothetical protein [Lysobacter sp. S4-A87]UNK48576.1 hypothetical protein MNR01_12555 [Lysobacter sp. S4-A87]